MTPARSWEKGGCSPGKLFYAVLSPDQFWGHTMSPNPYVILGAVPKDDEAGDRLPPSLTPLLPCGSTRAAHGVPCITQLTTAWRKNNDLC